MLVPFLMVSDTPNVPTIAPRTRLFWQVIGDSTNDASQLMKREGVRSVPSFHFWKGGKKVHGFFFWYFKGQLFSESCADVHLLYFMIAQKNQPKPRSRPSPGHDQSGPHTSPFHTADSRASLYPTDRVRSARCIRTFVYVGTWNALYALVPYNLQVFRYVTVRSKSFQTTARTLLLQQQLFYCTAVCW